LDVPCLARQAAPIADADFPALRLDEVFDDRQAESSAAEFPRTGLVDAIETLKQTGEIFRGDADAGILDEDFSERKGGEIAYADDDARALVLQRSGFGPFNEAGWIVDASSARAWPAGRSSPSS
jgi:hypothetical protein